MSHDHQESPVVTAHKAPGSSLNTLSELRKKCHTPISGGHLRERGREREVIREKERERDRESKRGRESEGGRGRKRK